MQWGVTRDNVTQCGRCGVWITRKKYARHVRGCGRGAGEESEGGFKWGWGGWRQR